MVAIWHPIIGTRCLSVNNRHDPSGTVSFDSLPRSRAPRHPSGVQRRPSRVNQGLGHVTGQGSIVGCHGALRGRHGPRVPRPSACDGGKHLTGCGRIGHAAPQGTTASHERTPARYFVRLRAQLHKAYNPHAEYPTFLFSMLIFK